MTLPAKLTCLAAILVAGSVPDILLAQTQDDHDTIFQMDRTATVYAINNADGAERKRGGRGTGGSFLSGHGAALLMMLRRMWRARPLNRHGECGARALREHKIGLESREDRTQWLIFACLCMPLNSASHWRCQTSI